MGRLPDESILKDAGVIQVILDQGKYIGKYSLQNTDNKQASPCLYKM